MNNVIVYTLTLYSFSASEKIANICAICRLDKRTIHCISPTEDSGDDQEKLLIYKPADRYYWHYFMGVGKHYIGPVGHEAGS